MNLLTNDNRAIGGPRIGSRHVGFCLRWFVWPTVLCLALIASDSVAAQCGGGQQGPTVKKTSVAQPKTGEARWVCPQTSVEIEPVWRGDQIECPFIIRNEGSANLEIKAKGG